MTMLQRSPQKKRLELKFDRLGKDGVFSGYASLFNEPDLGNDLIANGAFKQSIRKRGAANIRMLYQHDPTEPIGRWDIIREDNKGLFVEGRLVKSSPRANEVLALLNERAIDGLSIGFRTIKSRRDRKTGLRVITEADLWEISVVTFPMQPQARIADLKGASQYTTNALPSTREFENWLTRDAGLTRRQAKTVISRGFAELKGTRDVADNSIDLAEKMRSATRQLLNLPSK